MYEANLTCEERAEILRKKYLYRELILSGKIELSHARAAQLLGPDCLYRLYSAEKKKASGKRRQRGISR
jgi:hypothetical protein